MAEAQEAILRPWFLELVPAFVIILAVVHVVALGYWIYRLITDRLPLRRKAN